MGWWRRPVALDGGTDAMSSVNAQGGHVLVISDIHLGEDITIDGPVSLSEYIRALNRELTDFIRYHRDLGASLKAAERVGAKWRRAVPILPSVPAWHLVIDGDMFDFVKVSLTGKEVAVGGATGRPSIDLNTAVNVVRKLEHIMAIHRPLFRELAGFLRDGHRVTIVEGNHDAEFFFPEVQAALRAELIHLAQRPEPSGGVMPLAAGEQAALSNRLAFKQWFFAVGGLYHIEHGHQYDALCSFEYNLAPDDPLRAGTLATPLSHRPMPYLAEVLGDFSTHGIRDWSLRKALGFIRGLSPHAWLTMAKVYATLAMGLAGQSGRRRRRAMASRAEAHRIQLNQLAERDAQVYSLATLEQLDGFKAAPAEYSSLTMMHVFYFDRLLLTLAGVMAASAAYRTAGWAWATAMLAGTAVCNAGLNRIPPADIAVVLRAAAGRIAELTAVRYVVFGHSHAPEFIRLCADRAQPSCYINTGSWVTREILRGEAGTGMTYAEITASGARLLRWRGKGSSPQVLASDWDDTAHTKVCEKN